MHIPASTWKEGLPPLSREQSFERETMAAPLRTAEKQSQPQPGTPMEARAGEPSIVDSAPQTVPAIRPSVSQAPAFPPATGHEKLLIKEQSLPAAAAEALPPKAVAVHEVRVTQERAIRQDFFRFSHEPVDRQRPLRVTNENLREPERTPAREDREGAVSLPRAPLARAGVTPSTAPLMPNPVLSAVAPTTMTTAPQRVTHEHGTATEDAPSVQVTIGRIIVEAVMPPVPAKPEPVRQVAARPRLSLEEYLRQRGGLA